MEEGLEVLSTARSNNYNSTPASTLNSNSSDSSDIKSNSADSNSDLTWNSSIASNNSSVSSNSLSTLFQAKNQNGKSILLGGILNALSLSPDSTHAVLVGREVLKICRLSEDEIKETQNLRVGVRLNLNYSSVDVKWHPMEQHKYMIATAATNGAVVIWNINRPGPQKQERVINDHTRTVNRISWHSDHAYTLLSGSQDGTMKLWDIRDPSNCKVTFDGKSDSVRDVQFSPHYTNYFAAAFDNGTVQIWDIRKHSSYERKITAHQGPVFCLDWHPEETALLATGGRDRLIQVWDLNSGGGSVSAGTSGSGVYKPVYTVQTVSSVARINWRPNHKFHIASSALVDAKIHVWDVKNPFIPYASFVGHQDIVTDICWHKPNDNRILSCAKDTAFMCQDIRDSYIPYEHVRSVGLSWNAKGELAVISQRINRKKILENEGGSNIPTLNSVHSSTVNSTSSGNTSAINLSNHSMSLSNITSNIANNSGSTSNNALASGSTNSTNVNSNTGTNININSSNASSFFGTFGASSNVGNLSLAPPSIQSEDIIGASGHWKANMVYTLSSVTASSTSSASTTTNVPLTLASASVSLSLSNSSESLPKYSANNSGFSHKNLNNRPVPPANATNMLFNDEVWRYFAEMYRYDGDSFHQLCKHNAKVALEAQQHHVSNTWLLYLALFPNEPEMEIHRKTENSKTNNDKTNAHALDNNLDEVTGNSSSIKDELKSAIDGVNNPVSVSAKLSSSSPPLSLDNSTPFLQTSKLNISTGTNTNSSTNNTSIQKNNTHSPVPLLSSDLDSGIVTLSSLSMSGDSLSLSGDGLLFTDRSASGRIGTSINSNPNSNSSSGNNNSNASSSSPSPFDPLADFLSSDVSVPLAPLPSSMSANILHSSATTTTAVTPATTLGTNALASAPVPTSAGVSKSSLSRSSDSVKFISNENKNIGKEVSSNSPSTNSSATMLSTFHHESFYQSLQMELRWNARPIVEDTLAFYAENGDVQSSVVMSIVLGDRIKIPNKLLRQWFLAYIDILHRLQLWNHANEIIKKSTEFTVRSVNQSSTTVHTSCPQCNKALIALGWMCSHCKHSPNSCSLCHEPVRGLYTWCQGCGHGGHLNHMSEWFLSERYCPTGCGHACNFKVPLSRNNSKLDGTYASTSTSTANKDKEHIISQLSVTSVSANSSGTFSNK